MRIFPLALAATLALAAAPPPAALSQNVTKPPPQPAPRPVDVPVRSPGTNRKLSGSVYVGEKAPDFQLDGSHGKPVKLSSYRGDWVLMAFADRKEEAGHLRMIAEDMSSIGVQILAVCDEKAYSLVAFERRDSLPLTLVAYVTGEISALYGLYDNERSTIRPGYFVIDRQGVVRMALLGQRLPPGDVGKLVRFSVVGF